MALPSLLDALIVITLLLPGFVAFHLFRFLAVFERKLEEYETVIWSLLWSLAVYAIFALTTGVRDLDALRERVFEPSSLTLLTAATLLLGFLPGTIWHLVFNRGTRPFRGDPWDLFFVDVAKVGGRDLVVLTQDGREFQGWGSLVGKEDNRREIVIMEPVMVLRGSSGDVVKEIPYGEQMLFTERDVSRVAMLGPRSDAKAPREAAAKA